MICFVRLAQPSMAKELPKTRQRSCQNGVFRKMFPARIKLEKSAERPEIDDKTHLLAGMQLGSVFLVEKEPERSS